MPEIPIAFDSENCYATERKREWKLSVIEQVNRVLLPIRHRIESAGTSANLNILIQTKRAQYTDVPIKRHKEKKFEC